MKTVIKIGTSTLAHTGGRLNIRRTEELCKVISDLKNSGNEIIIVTSGAIGMGTGKLGLKERPADMATKQAAAAVGQCELMYVYDKLFSEYNHTVAQILVTASDFNHDDRHRNFSVTLSRLLDLGVIPIINENDTIATEEIGIGDNDTLAAMVATSAGADLLILLSDVEGLYSADPRKDPNAKLIEEIRVIDDSVMKLGGGSGSSLGTGGMRTKLSAAKICTEAGCDMIIADGSDPSVLYTIADGGKAGTRFYGKKTL
ncbi:MAG: glutamate 5-kinase [Firmicutes bacterium]|nr:glutamate 5-kinase [Candidatus Colimorpha enterica]